LIELAKNRSTSCDAAPGRSRMVATTRSRRAADSSSDISSHPHLVAHVLTTLQEHHGVDALDEVAAVCSTWCKVVQLCQQVDPSPEHRFGELRSGDKPLRFDRPHGAVFLPSGDVCIADCDNFRLQVVTRDGVYVNEIRLSGGTSCPTGVAIKGGFFYVIEHGAHCVSKIRCTTLTGERVCKVGAWGGGDGELRHPWGVALALGHVYVSDSGNHRVCVFDAEDLHFLFSFGSIGRGKGQLREPRGVAASEAELFVADSLNHRVQVFSLKNGDFVRSIGGGESTSRGRFKQPSGLTIFNDRLYITEARGERLQVMSLDGLPMQSIKVGGQLSGVCADADHVCVTALEGEAAINLLPLRCW